MVPSFNTAKVRLALCTCERQRFRRLFDQCQEGPLWQTRVGPIKRAWYVERPVL